MIRSLFQARKKGFTLIELLVVISIIGLLSSIVLTSLTAARTKANDAYIVSERQQIQLALETYYNDNGGYPNPTEGTAFCIGGTDCVLAGASISSQLAIEGKGKSLADKGSSPAVAAVFSFPAVNAPQFIDSDGNVNKGFVYVPCGSSYPGLCPSESPAYLLSVTHASGVVQQQVGHWDIIQYSSVSSSGSSSDSSSGSSSDSSRSDSSSDISSYSSGSDSGSGSYYGSSYQYYGSNPGNGACVYGSGYGGYGYYCDYFSGFSSDSSSGSSSYSSGSDSSSDSSSYSSSDSSSGSYYDSSYQYFGSSPGGDGCQYGNGYDGYGYYCSYSSGSSSDSSSYSSSSDSSSDTYYGSSYQYYGSNPGSGSCYYGSGYSGYGYYCN